MDPSRRPADQAGRLSLSESAVRGRLPFLVIGEVLGPHGVTGTLRVRSLTDFPERFERLKTVHVGESLRPYEVESASVSGGTVLLKLKGVDTADEAAKLRGALLRVPRHEAVPLGPGEYYYDEIIGLTVRTTDGELLGHVVDILRTGANDVYVVEGPRGEVLIPAIADVVKEIRPDQELMIVEPMPGLLD